MKMTETDYFDSLILHRAFVYFDSIILFGKSLNLVTASVRLSSISTLTCGSYFILSERRNEF